MISMNAAERLARAYANFKIAQRDDNVRGVALYGPMLMASQKQTGIWIVGPNELHEAIAQADRLSERMVNAARATGASS